MPSVEPAPPGRVTRFGLALAKPRWALAIADDPAESGRAGTDLVVLLLVAFVAIHTRELVAAGWLATAVDPGKGLGVIVGILSRTVTIPLAWLLVGAAVIWAFAGPRRALGRDFDLACVAIVPLVVVEIVASLVVRATGVDVPPAADWTIAGIGFAWSGVVIALGTIQARGRAGKATAGEAARHLPAAARKVGLGAGAAALAAASLVLAIQGVWVIRHIDWLRPMVEGDQVPAFALPKIEAGGRLGEAVTSESLADKVVVIDFWATWCGPCRDALPDLSALAGRGKGHIIVLSVNLDDAEEARRMFDEAGYRSTLVADAGGAAQRFQVGPIPHLVVVDRGGVVRMVSRGDGNLRDVIGLAEELGGLHGHGR